MGRSTNKIKGLAADISDHSKFGITILWFFSLLISLFSQIFASTKWEHLPVSFSWSCWLHYPTPEALLRCSSQAWLLETSVFSNTLIPRQFSLSFSLLCMTRYFKHEAGLIFTSLHIPTGCTGEELVVGDIHRHHLLSDIFVNGWKSYLR